MLKYLLIFVIVLMNKNVSSCRPRCHDKISHLNKHYYQRYYNQVEVKDKKIKDDDKN